MSHEPKEFPCMDDSPENNGFGYNNNIWENRPRRFYEEEDFWDDVDFPKKESSLNEKPVTVVNRNDGSMECG